MGKLLKVYKNFSGGLSEVANDNMKDNELVTAQNAEPSSTYGIQRCGGTAVYEQVKWTYEEDEESQTFTAGDIRYIIPFTAYMQPTGETPYFQEQLVVIAKETDYFVFYVKNLPDGNWQHNISGWIFSDIKDYFVFANKLYILTGSEICRWQWDDTEQGYQLVELDRTTVNAELPEAHAISENAWAALKTAVCVEQRGARWFYGVGRDEVYYTGSGEPLGVKSMPLNFITQDNDKITALHVFNDNLLIFKKHSIFQLSGWDFDNNSDLSVSRLNVVSGTEYPDSIATIDNGVLYLGGSGIGRLSVPYYSSITAVEIISIGKISKRLFKNHGKPAVAKGVVWDGKYYISLTFSDGTQEEYRYILKDKSFWGPYTQGATCYCPSALEDDHLYIGAKNGYILYYDDNEISYKDINANGINMEIPMVVRTKAYDVVGKMFQNAKVKKAFVAAKQFVAEDSDMYMQIKADYADDAKDVGVDSIQHVMNDALHTTSISFDDSLVWEKGEWSFENWGWIDTVTKQVAVGRKTKHFQFILKSKEKTPLVIYGFGLQYKRKKVKGDTSRVTPVDYIEVEPGGDGN